MVSYYLKTVDNYHFLIICIDKKVIAIMTTTDLWFIFNSTKVI